MPILPDTTHMPLPDEGNAAPVCTTSSEAGEPTDGKPCALCGGATTADDFCYGCKNYVCDTCDPGLSDTCGAHDVADHLEHVED